MRIVWIVLAGVAIVGAIHELSMRPLEWPPGILAAGDPRQGKLDGAPPVEHAGFTLTPRATFSAEVRVLARERYRLGDLAGVVPLDVAVGWGRMSDSAVLADLDISQANRFYFWHYDDEEPPIPAREIETHSANWHLVPGSPAVWDRLSAIRVGDIVTFEGDLVDIERSDLGIIRTSLSRDDTGAGACEVILVRSAAVRYR